MDNIVTFYSPSAGTDTDANETNVKKKAVRQEIPSRF